MSAYVVNFAGSAVVIDDTLSLVAERIMMLIVGAVFLGGGLLFVKQAFDGSKDVIQSVLFGILGVATGIWLCLWAITGIPEG